MQPSFRRLTATVVAAATLVLGACGSDGATNATETKAATTPSGTFPVTVEAANGPVVIATAPKRIVSLSPTATEMLFAMDAGPQVAAVDDQSNFPPEAPMTELSGFTPNIEAVVGMNPDLVVVAEAPDDLAAGLAKAKIPLLVLPAAETIEDSYAQLATLGKATGQVEGADEVVASMKGQIADIVAKVPERATKLTYYHELDDTLYSSTSKTFIGSVYSLLGLANIADAADKDGSGYPQLSQEYLVQANPDLIFLADTKCCKQTAATVAARPGWASLRAVSTKAVVELDDDIAMRWGPRIVDFLDAVATAVAAQPAK